MAKVYIIGSLRNPVIPEVSETLRKETEYEVFDDWYAAGPEADDFWKSYEVNRGHSYSEALDGYAAKHVFDFDKHHLDTSSAAILVLPAGRSGHLELGYMAGKGARTYILLDKGYVDEGRYDVMYRFANIVTLDLQEIIKDLKENNNVRVYPDPSTLPNMFKL